MGKGSLIKLGIAAAVLILLAITVRAFVGGSSYNPQKNAESITLVCEESGEEWTVMRGFLMDQLYRRQLPLDKERGFSSPHAEGRLVAFPKSGSAWNSMINEATAQMEAVTRDDD
ncbi:MAG: hypothetical protein AAF747_08005 [Planctomycetota bacterium]